MSNFTTEKEEEEYRVEMYPTASEEKQRLANFEQPADESERQDGRKSVKKRLQESRQVGLMVLIAIAMTLMCVCCVFVGIPTLIATGYAIKFGMTCASMREHSISFSETLPSTMPIKIQTERANIWLERVEPFSEDITILNDIVIKSKDDSVMMDANSWQSMSSEYSLSIKHDEGILTFTEAVCSFDSVSSVYKGPSTDGMINLSTNNGIVAMKNFNDGQMTSAVLSSENGEALLWNVRAKTMSAMVKNGKVQLEDVNLSVGNFAVHDGAFFSHKLVLAQDSEMNCVFDLKVNNGVVILDGLEILGNNCQLNVEVNNGDIRLVRFKAYDGYFSASISNGAIDRTQSSTISCAANTKTCATQVGSQTGNTITLTINNGHLKLEDVPNDEEMYNHLYNLDDHWKSPRK